ncbi:mandelate racemase/muconate lactonizing enzyme family protein [Streptomyces sp. NPDC051218]|uniref:mandelate racemase/muconate lactonizing enzyme family protein n=1 Tax=Streptomyces sp. NPDC051218 TaxID=3365645 RepID=UPI0037B7BE4E
MKITDIRLDRLRLDLDPPFHAAWDPEPRRHFDATIVRVETDEGVTGIGSGDTMDGFDAFRHLFVGTDPLQIMRHIRTIETINFHAGRFWPLEAALWDLMGKVTGLPVATLFGNTATRMPAYMSTGELKSPQARVESALAARAEGFRAMKIRIARDGIEKGVESVRGVREALGDDFAIMVDLNQSWRMAGDVEPALDAKTVRRTVARLAELGVTWVEEPLPYSDRSGLRQLRSGTEVRIAGGEMFQTFDDVLTHLDEDLLDVYQMDVVLAIGMHRARTAAELAQQRNRQFTPHSWTNGIGVLANLHVAVGVGAAPYFEFPYDPEGWTVERRDFMLGDPVRIYGDGFVGVTDAPGLGITLDEEAVERCRRR